MKSGGILHLLFAVAATLCASQPGRAGLPETPLTTVRVASGLAEPLYVTHAPGDHSRIFIVEQGGRIKILKNGELLATPFLNIDPIASSGGERGLLGLAFHPDYETNGEFFVNYTNSTSGATTISRYTVSADPDVANPLGDIILVIPQPFPNHNGGWLSFGPDGYLYIATGDGGDANDPLMTGQNNVGDLLGNLLRIDVDGDDFPSIALRDYAIPPDNPFVGMAGEDEIWAYGLRNPWRCAFDSELGDLYMGDVGQSDREEINFQPATSTGGENYGWLCMEGTICTAAGGCDCETLDAIDPIHEYDLGSGRCSITGGEVYRGCAIPGLQGTYFFADFCSAEIWSMRVVDGVETDFRNRTVELDPGGGLDIGWISSFGLDADGEIYICDLFEGEVFKIVAAPPLTTIETFPPDGAIDARRHIESDGITPVGWSQVSYTFDNPAQCTALKNFATSQLEASADTPTILTIEANNNTASVALDRVIEPRTWTTIHHGESRSTIRIASLPADVNADGTSNASDIATLVSALTGDIAMPRIWSTDINRSGVVTGCDILSTVDLLSGAIGDKAFLDASLP